MTSSFQAYAASVLSLEGVAYSESPAATNKWLAVALTNPLIEGSSEFASHLCKLYNLAEPAIQEVSRIPNAPLFINNFWTSFLEEQKMYCLNMSCFCSALSIETHMTSKVCRTDKETVSPELYEQREFLLAASRVLLSNRKMAHAKLLNSAADAC